MCHIFTMTYEFNNWEALEHILKFVTDRHHHNYPQYKFEVPLSVEGFGWTRLAQDSLRLMGARLNCDVDIKAMTVYGKIWFKCTEDENLNNEFWRLKR